MIGEVVECRDTVGFCTTEHWNRGTVTAVKPLQIRRDDGTVGIWDEVRKVKVTYILTWINCLFQLITNIKT